MLLHPPQIPCSHLVRDLLFKFKQQLFKCSNYSKMDIKVEIKEEPCFLNLCSQNERELSSKDFLKIPKIEIVNSGSDCDIDIKTEIEKEFVVSNFCLENQREFVLKDSVTEYINVNKDCVFEPKMEFKEQQYCVERTSTEYPSIYDDVKCQTDEDFHSTESPRLYKQDASSITSDLFCNEDIVEDISSNIKNDSPECKRIRKCQSQETNVTDISSLETSVCSKIFDGEKNANLVSYLKQNNSCQQSI